MKRNKPQNDRQETEFDWDDNWYDIRQKPGTPVFSTSIEQLREQSRRFWEEQERIRDAWNRLNPLERAQQRTEAARNLLEGKSTSHLSPCALEPVAKETITPMQFKVIACIDGHYCGEWTVWASVSEKEHILLKQHYQTDSDPCACRELWKLYERIVQEASVDAETISREYRWEDKPVAFFYGVPEEICRECRLEYQHGEESEYQAIYNVFRPPRGQPKRYQDKEIQAKNQTTLFHNWLYEKYAETRSVEKELALFFRKHSNTKEYENAFNWYLEVLFDVENDDFMRCFRRMWPTYDGWRYVEHETTLVLEHGIVRSKGLWEAVRKLPVTDYGFDVSSLTKSSPWYKKLLARIKNMAFNHSDELHGIDDGDENA